MRNISTDHVVVVSDEVAQDGLQTDLMRMAVPAHVQLHVLPVSTAAETLKEGRWDKERVILLAPGLREIRRLLEAGVVFQCVNLGGLHDAPGRKQVTASISLSKQDKEDLVFILQQKVAIDTRILPCDESRDIVAILNKTDRNFQLLQVSQERG